MHTKARTGSLDRLHIAHLYAATLHRYGRAAAAIDLLQTALDELPGGQQRHAAGRGQ